MGWVKVDVPLTTLTDGTIYHLVVEYLSGTIDSGNRIQFHADQQLFTYIPLTTMNDANLLMNTWFNNSQWLPRDSTPEFLLEYANGSQYGLPYNGSWIRSVYGSFRAAQQFVVPESITVSSLELRVAKSDDTGPAAPLQFRISNLTTPAVLISGDFVTGDEVIKFSGTDVVLPITDTDLIAGQIYRLELFCDTCEGVSGFYRILGRKTGTTSSPFVENTFQGGQGFGETSSDSGSTWIADPADDMKFLFEAYSDQVFEDGFELVN